MIKKNPQRGKIEELVLGLAAQYETRNPYKLARSLGIDVVQSDLGALKGMYTRILDRDFIVINENLTEPIGRLVCAHELGHTQLHRDMLGLLNLNDFTLYDMKSRPEYEANVFAAHQLLDTETVLAHAKCGADAVGIAQLCGTDVNLVLIKLHEMCRDGYQLTPQCVPRADFLKAPLQR